MKQAIGLCVAAVLVSSAAFGVDYTFTGTKFNEQAITGGFAARWDNALNWTPGLINKGTTADSYSIALDCSTTKNVRLPRANGNPGNTRYFGSVTVTGGTLSFIGVTGGGSDIYRLQADNGQNGSLSITGANSRLAADSWNQGVTWDVDGSVTITPGLFGTSSMEPLANSVIRMRGLPTGTNNRTYSVARSAGTGNNWVSRLQVDSGVTNLTFVKPGAAADCVNAVSTVILNPSNSASGVIYVHHRANAQTLSVASGTDVTQLDVNVCHMTDYASGDGTFSGRHYRDFYFTNNPGGYWGGTMRTETLHILDGDLWVRSLTVNPVISGGNNSNDGLGGGAGSGTVTFRFDTDNNGVTRNVTVDGDAKFGRSGYTSRIRSVFKTNSSVVDIGRDLIFYKNGNVNGRRQSYLLGGSATIRVGRNFTVENGTCAIAEGWNPGTSKFIFDNAFGGAQLITSAGAAGLQSVPFYDVQISNPGGTVTLADNLVLKGDFGLVAGSFNPASYYVIFKGGIDCETTAQEIDVNNADLKKVRLMAGSSTYAKLISDLTVTGSLDIDAGCKLFLNGFTLTAEGQTITSTTPWDQGEIVGAGAIPEPATWLLLGTGALGVLGYVRRRRMI